MKRKLSVATLVASVALMFTADALAQAKPDVLVKQRKAVMTLQGKYFGPMAGMAQGKIPYNAGVVQRNAAFLEALSKMPWDGFDASTKGEKSAALPAVWEKSGEFKQAAERLENEAAKLASVSKSGDEAAVKAQIGAVGKSCGGCHETFREKQQ
jgi:cytochrome c556